MVKNWTNYYYDKSGKYLGTGTSDGYYKPIDGMNIRYYGLFEAGPQPAVPFGCINVNGVRSSLQHF